MELLRPHEIAKFLKLTPPSIRRLIRAGELPSVKIGGRLYIVKDMLEQKIKEKFDHFKVR